MIDPNSFHIKAENKRFPAARAFVVGRTSNFKLSRRRLADTSKKLNQKAFHTSSTINFARSINRIIDLLICRSHRRFLYSLLQTQPQRNTALQQRQALQKKKNIRAQSHLNGKLQSPSETDTMQGYDWEGWVGRGRADQADGTKEIGLNRPCDMTS